LETIAFELFEHFLFDAVNGFFSVFLLPSEKIELKRKSLRRYNAVLSVKIETMLNVFSKIIRGELG
jgi:hypothetical protein